MRFKVRFKVSGLWAMGFIMRFRVPGQLMGGMRFTVPDQLSHGLRVRFRVPGQLGHGV